MLLKFFDQIRQSSEIDLRALYIFIGGSGMTARD